MLRFEKYIIRSASLGVENPLPDIKNVSYIHAGFEVTDRVTTEERAGLGKGKINTLLPYTNQDNYDRNRNDRAFNAAILENKYIKAVFLPELGGRLWSLEDKTTGKEVLYKNCVYQPCNLALRNAWFSGGVEFNVGIKGHNPLTCSPLFAKKLTYKGGEEVLCMYEYERIREVVYSINAYLPEDSKVLYIKNRIENTSDDDKYMYWWSNIAVTEEDGIRVIVPTDESFLCFYDEGRYLLDKVQLPECMGFDATYPENSHRCFDFFYKIPKAENKWIASAHKDGSGLLHFSTSEFIGRKMFLWGQANGGRNWNSWLTEDDRPYIEIQAGLAHTQLEHIPMKAKETWQFIEAYTPLDCAPEDLHNDWHTAQNAVKAQLSTLIDTENLDKAMYGLFPDGEVISEEKLWTGSGWGEVENEIRKLTGKAPISNLIDDWDNTDCDQAPWKYLLKNGEFPAYSVDTRPHSYVSHAFWRDLLIKATQGSEAQRWYAYNQLGVHYYIAEEIDNAEEAFRKSIEAAPNAWAYRNLGMLLYKEKNRLEDGIPYMLKSIELVNDFRGLFVEVAQMLQAAGRHAEWLDIFEGMNPILKEDGRLNLLKILSLINVGELDKAAAMLTPDFKMADIKEGELSVSQIWFDLYKLIIKRDTGITDEDEVQKILLEKYPLPKTLDFRMHG